MAWCGDCVWVTWCGDCVRGEHLGLYEQRKLGMRIEVSSARQGGLNPHVAVRENSRFLTWGEES